MIFGWENKQDIAESFVETDYKNDWKKPQNKIDAILKDLEGLIFANLDSWSYEESTRILFEKEGKLYEVYASHCSCNGFEDQWNPEETSWEQLKKIEPEYFAEDKEGQKYFKELIDKH